MRAGLSGKSPTSLAIAARQIVLCRDATFEDALRMDFRIVSRLCTGVDFYEGVRALIIDKDKSPHWTPSGIEDVNDAMIDPFFSHR